MSESKPLIAAGSLIIDTSAVIALFRGRKGVLDHFNLATTVLLPVTVVGELYCGLRKCNDPQKERLKVQGVQDRCTILEIDEDVAHRYADIYSDLERKGTLIPLNDIWIAACAIRHQTPLLAHDAHFQRVRDLELRQLA